jgi:glutathione synthase/RimK-type ligase-like ATP-grasp enzyme
MRSLSGVRHYLGLDYAGIDFGLDSEGRLLLFEANATMVVARPNDDARWAYRRAATDRILQAVTAMIEKRAGTVERFGA